MAEGKVLRFPDKTVGASGHLARKAEYHNSMIALLKHRMGVEMGDSRADSDEVSTHLKARVRILREAESYLRADRMGPAARVWERVLEHLVTGYVHPNQVDEAYQAMDEEPE